jgi:hypothetical protein
MIAIKENAHKYEAEIKLCFNLLQDFLKDSFYDSDKERQLKEDIVKIDCVLFEHNACDWVSLNFCAEHNNPQCCCQQIKDI